MTSKLVAWLPLLAAALTAALCAFLSRRQASAWRVNPSTDNPCHRTGSKLVAGVIPVSVALCLCAVALLTWRAGAILLFTGGLSVVGWIDDRKPYTPRGKLLAQAPLFGLGLASLPAALTAHQPWLWAPLGLAALLILTNAVNIVDVADGLAPGVCSLTLGGVGLILLGQGKFELSHLALIFASATLGFLLFNAPPASVVLGDAGSLALGGVSVALIPHCIEAAAGRLFLVLPLLAFVPLLEVSWVSYQRLRRGIPPWTASPHHFVYWLVERGLSVPRAVTMILIVQALAVSAAAWLCGVGGAVEWTAGVVLGVTALSWIRQKWTTALGNRVRIRVSP
ncbi:MAG: MraY family glycosyltransferase [Polyangiaceae bacterium]